MANGTGYTMRVLIAFDMFWNVVFGGLYGQTISARVGLHHAWYDRAVAAALDRLQAGHCGLAKLHDIQRDQQAILDMEERQ